MTDSPDDLQIINYSDSFGLLKESVYSQEHDELLTVGESGAALLSTSGSIVDSILFSMDEDGFCQDIDLLASVRDDSGWRILLKEKDRLFIVKFSQSSSDPVYFEGKEPHARSATWSPCGQFIAVGSTDDSNLSVWHTVTGKLLWKRTAVFDIEGEPFNSPSLSVTGWSSNGKCIVTMAEYLTFLSIIIWKSGNGDIETIIN